MNEKQKQMRGESENAEKIKNNNNCVACIQEKVEEKFC